MDVIGKVKVWKKLYLQLLYPNHAILISLMAQGALVAPCSLICILSAESICLHPNESILITVKWMHFKGFNVYNWTRNHYNVSHDGWEICIFLLQIITILGHI